MSGMRIIELSSENDGRNQNKFHEGEPCILATDFFFFFLRMQDTRVGGKLLKRSSNPEMI